jgi:hypothetical protein
MELANVSFATPNMFEMLLINQTATYIDFYDASRIRWVEAANSEKGKRLMNLYGDDTFIKLVNKVKPYEGGDGGL